MERIIQHGHEEVKGTAPPVDHDGEDLTEAGTIVTAEWARHHLLQRPARDDPGSGDPAFLFPVPAEDVVLEAEACGHERGLIHVVTAPRLDEADQVGCGGHQLVFDAGLPLRPVLAVASPHVPGDNRRVDSTSAP